VRDNVIIAFADLESRARCDARCACIPLVAGSAFNSVKQLVDLVRLVRLVGCVNLIERVEIPRRGLFESNGPVHNARLWSESLATTVPNGR
jgi:hypothetical protein